MSPTTCSASRQLHQARASSDTAFRSVLCEVAEFRMPLVLALPPAKSAAVVEARAFQLALVGFAKQADGPSEVRLILLDAPTSK